MEGGSTAMSKIVMLVLAAITILAADNPWTKVRELKSGSELRIYKKGASQPIIATMDEANDERLIALVKNEQLAFAKADIDRIDARPETKGGRMIKTTTSTNTELHDKVAAPGPQGQMGPSSSTSTSFSNRPKPDFETIYRRGAARRYLPHPARKGAGLNSQPLGLQPIPNTDPSPGPPPARTPTS